MDPNKSMNVNSSMIAGLFDKDCLWKSKDNVVQNMHLWNNVTLRENVRVSNKLN